MSNAYLKGDETFKSKMLEMQKMINNDFQQLQSASEQAESVVEAVNVKSLIDRWGSIERDIFSLSPENSFNKHTSLITLFLNMIEDATELTSIYSVSQLIDNDDNALLIKAVIHDIPYLTETLGQARGLGTGVAAQAECSVANKIKLNFIHHNGMKVLNETVKTLLDSHHPMLTANKASLEQCSKITNSFLECLKNNLIDADEIKIAPAEYYETATSAIDVSFQLLDELLAVLEVIVLRKK